MCDCVSPSGQRRFAGREHARREEIDENPRILKEGRTHKHKGDTGATGYKEGRHLGQK